MEENKLFNEIKSAADNAESKDFPGMENVWQRVESKLDKKKDKKTIELWKKIAVAACLLLFATLGYQFFNTNQKDEISDNEVTVNDSVEVPNNETVVTAAPSTEIKQTQAKRNPAIKEEAEAILQQQLNPASQVALEEVPTMQSPLQSNIQNPQTSTAYFVNPATKLAQDKLLQEDDKKSNGEVELFMNRKAPTSTLTKEQPLVVIDDKVIKEKLENIEFTDADSLVVLKEPLYIINGVEYTEQEVFGPNPTSPYTPLAKQEIETISILQNEKAVEVYGKKGEKGVVIITTKTRKPFSTVTKPKK